ncbi:MAG: TolC family protein [candidate division FCPU426 bacterium]
MRKMLPVLLAAVFASAAAQAETPSLSLGLDQAVQEAQTHTPSLQAKQWELKALGAKSWSYAGLLWPRLSLEGTWRYVTEVPNITLPMPGARSIPMGDNVNYSVGPQLSWTIWDSGATYYAWQALSAGYRAKEQEVEGQQREITLKTRLAYFQVQLALEQIRLLADSLQLAQAQYRDIQAQARAGASSRIDLLSSHLEVLARQRQIQQARTQLTGAVRDLLSLTGGGESLDLAFPMDPETAKQIASDIETPTLLLMFDPLEQSLARLDQPGKAPAAGDHPRAKVFTELAESARQAAAGYNAGHWPRVQVYAKASWDYPNGPVLETVQQNTVGVNASWPLWEGQRVVRQVEEQERTAKADEAMAQQAQTDLDVGWKKAQDTLAQLRAELKLVQQSSQETETLARLVYQAYHIGRANYLEVQAANLRALEAKTQFALTRTQMAIQLAVLDSLSENEETKP